jgi:hypothetical protein
MAPPPAEQYTDPIRGKQDAGKSADYACLALTGRGISYFALAAGNDMRKRASEQLSDYSMLDVELRS